MKEKINKVKIIKNKIFYNLFLKLEMNSINFLNA